MQLHFGTYRNVNTAAFARVGRDAGYDIMRGQTDTDRLVRFLDGLMHALPCRAPCCTVSIRPAFLRWQP